MSYSNITKQALASSLKKLMAERSFEKIHVGDIVSDSGLTRQTFYYHFKDKYDLLNWIYSSETAHFMTGGDSFSHWTDGLKHLCSYMQGNKVFYRNALKTRGQNSFPEYLYAYISDMSSLAIEMMQKKEYDPEKWDFIVRFFSSAFVSFLVQWADSGMEEDPNIFIEKMRALFDGSVLRELEDGEEKPCF